MLTQGEIPSLAFNEGVRLGVVPSSPWTWNVARWLLKITRAPITADNVTLNITWKVPKI